MSSLSVGKEALSYCNKCKLNLAHLIVNMKNETTIGKVECKTCHATHAYKDPSTVKVKKSKTGVKRKSTKQTISELWLEAVEKSGKDSQKYSPRSKFEINDLIEHPSWGPGVVERVIDTDKIQVIFRHDIKTLIHNK